MLDSFISLLLQQLQAVFYGAAGRLNPAWRPCNIGKLGQDNEDYYYYYYYEALGFNPFRDAPNRLAQPTAPPLVSPLAA
jgi:hypothetical protein